MSVRRLTTILLVATSMAACAGSEAAAPTDTGSEPVDADAASTDVGSDDVDAEMPDATGSGSDAVDTEDDGVTEDDTEAEDGEDEDDTEAENGEDDSDTEDDGEDGHAQADAGRADLLAETSEVFADLEGDRPGCSVGVRSDGRDEVLSFGQADLAAGVDLDDETIYDIGSVSKQMAAGAVALLVLDETVALDDDITEWLDVGPYESTITVADLVHHTSGLPDYTEQLDADDSEVTTNEDAMDVMTDGVDDEPMFDPGTGFDYSNTNYLFLSELVDALSGRTLVEFAHDEIFVPLEMDHTVFRDDQGTLLDGQAQGYEQDGDDFVEVGSSWRQTGDGAVHAPVADLLVWADAFLEPTDGDGVGSATWVELMTQPGLVTDDDGTAYGFGLELADGRLSHGGSWIGYSSAIVMDPDLGLAVAVACNLDGVEAEGLADQVMDVWT